MILATTPSQTVGPYYSIGLHWPGGEHAMSPEAPNVLGLTGTVRDGAGQVVPDFLIETWQADADGRFADAHGHGGASTCVGFRGWARVAADGGDGSFAIVTVKPGRVVGPGGVLQAPHIAVGLMGRGITQRLVTRVYFADEPAANAEDPVLTSVPPERRETLLARAVPGGYAWDIRLQGASETVFFAI